ncbi:MAG: ABC transporter ATP-binding protein [Bacillota bacterium]|nr:ABC transporter ATP-binding protein [Bacillota bacterium]
MKGTRRSGIAIILSLIKLLKPLRLEMSVAILMGTLSHISTFALGIFGIYAIISSIPALAPQLQGLFFGGFSIKTYLIILVVAGFMRGVLHYIEQFFNHLIAFKVLAIIRNKIFAQIRKLAPAKLESKNPGQLISLIMGDIELLEVFYAHTVSPIAIAFLCSLSLFIFYLKISFWAALVALASQVYMAILLPLSIAKKTNRLSLDVRNQIGDLNGKFIDQVRGIKETIQYSNGDNSLKELDQVTEDLLEKQWELKKIGAELSSYVEIMIIFFGLIQFLVSVLLVQRGMMSMSGAVVACMLTIGSFGPFVSLANLGAMLNNTFACGERVLTLLEETPIVEAVTNGVDIENGDIELKAVDFAYAEEDGKVLENFDLKINKGEILGIMAESGRGKSTILKLIMRFWDVDKGSVEFSGKNIKDINTHSIYDKINYMRQTTFLFTGSIRENMWIAKPGASDEEIYQALKLASIDEFVMGLKDGLDSYIGEDGVNFSGGERQRLGLAMCFLADREIFLLDEATSNLDSINEAMILKSILKNRNGKTVVIVSHRKSTLAVCDRIVEI